MLMLCHPPAYGLLFVVRLHVCVMYVCMCVCALKTTGFRCDLLSALLSRCSLFGAPCSLIMLAASNPCRGGVLRRWCTPRQVLHV